MEAPNAISDVFQIGQRSTACKTITACAVGSVCSKHPNCDKELSKLDLLLANACACQTGGQILHNKRTNAQSNNQFSKSFFEVEVEKMPQWQRKCLMRTQKIIQDFSTSRPTNDWLKQLTDHTCDGVVEPNAHERTVKCLDACA